MKDENGVVKIKGYYDGIEISDQVKKYLDNVPDDEESMLNKMQFKKPESVGNSYQESIQFPSLNVRGIKAGWVEDEVRTIGPSECIAEIDVRLVIESDGYRLHDLIKNHIKNQSKIQFPKVSDFKIGQSVKNHADSIGKIPKSQNLSQNQDSTGFLRDS